MYTTRFLTECIAYLRLTRLCTIEAVAVTLTIKLCRVRTITSCSEACHISLVRERHLWNGGVCDLGDIIPHSRRTAYLDGEAVSMVEHRQLAEGWSQ